MLQNDLSIARRAGVELLHHARAFCRLFFIAFLAGAQSLWQKETLEEYFKEGGSPYK